MVYPQAAGIFVTPTTFLFVSRVSLLRESSPALYWVCAGEDMFFGVPL